MKLLNYYRFSKIGTNPHKYLENFKYFINSVKIGDEINTKNLKVYHENVVIFECNSPSTFRQNIDTWLWMNFIIKKNENTFIKIVNQMSEMELLNYSKNSLLQDSQDKLIDTHKKTIIIKLLTLHNEKSCHPNYTFEEIQKECGKYEKVLLEDKKFIEIINLKWGD